MPHSLNEPNDILSALQKTSNETITACSKEILSEKFTGDDRDQIKNLMVKLTTENPKEYGEAYQSNEEVPELLIDETIRKIRFFQMNHNDIQFQFTPIVMQGVDFCLHQQKVNSKAESNDQTASDKNRVRTAK